MSENEKYTLNEDTKVKSLDRREAIKKLGKYSVTASAAVYTLTAKGDASTQGCISSGGQAAGCP